MVSQEGFKSTRLFTLMKALVIFRDFCCHTISIPQTKSTDHVLFPAAAHRNSRRGPGSREAADQKHSLGKRPPPEVAEAEAATWLKSAQVLSLLLLGEEV